MVVQVQVGLVPVVVSAVVAMVVGMLWYGPLFGKKWMALMGIKSVNMEAKKSEMPKSMAIGFVAALVTAYMIGVVVKLSQAASAADGAVIGGLTWLGFVATITLGSVLWEGKSVELYALNNAHHLVVFAITGAILATM